MDCEQDFINTELKIVLRAFEYLNQAAIVASLDRKILGLNQKGQELFGYELDELIGVSTEILYADSEDYIRLGNERYNTQGEVSDEEFTVKYKNRDGKIFHGATYGGVLKNGNGQSIGFVALVNDESVRLEIEEALNKLHQVASSRQLNFKQRVNAILKLGTELFKLPVGIFSRIEGSTYFIEQAVHPENILEEGMSFELEGTYCSHVYLANDVRGFNYVSKSEISTHPSFINFGLEAYLGTPIFVDGIRYGTLNFSSPEPCRAFTQRDYELVKLFSEWIGHEVARAQDMLSLEILNRKMQIVANTDELTGLSNRRCIEETLQKLLLRAEKTGKPLSVALIDFDHFKNINDTYGHSIGDIALKTFGSLVSNLSRDVDLYGRWGGEEFLAVLPETTIHGANSMLNRLANELRRVGLPEPASDVTLNVSIGLTCFKVGDDNTSILNRVDKLLYKAKNEGRAQICHDG
ncbi:sensor domain-containing diguanylate cyclase [Vibrio cholerae]|uniref:sensor domain-containing diguanylate cyclase n=1 Tax=Vibrio cholerae TaxID=666 RepID=UPI001A9E13D2|nr:diguanylate cyclase [Vibrio cholerae]MBO1396981.1 GGDEF domain-containing protein [Vibrio cholerae]